MPLDSLRQLPLGIFILTFICSPNKESFQQKAAPWAVTGQCLVVHA
jgi:hypothetical protein